MKTGLIVSLSFLFLGSNAMAQYEYEKEGLFDPSGEVLETYGPVHDGLPGETNDLDSEVSKEFANAVPEPMAKKSALSGPRHHPAKKKTLAKTKKRTKNGRAVAGKPSRTKKGRMVASKAARAKKIAKRESGVKSVRR